MENCHIMRQTVRSTVIDEPEVAVAPPASWTTHYLIQVVQNLTTGALVAGLIWVIWYWASGADAPAWAGPVCATIGLVWVVFWTVMRFHADEFGLMRLWYRAGQRSRDAEVNALWMELETLRDAATAGAGNPGSETDRRIAVANATLRNARALLRVVYEHGAAQGARAAMAGRGMGQRDWERARRLCMAAGVIDELMQPRAASLAHAVKLVEDLHGTSVQALRQSPRTGVAWL